MTEQMKKISLKKLTPKDIMGYGKKDFAFKVPEQRTFLYQVYGAVDRTREKGTQFNTDQKLLLGRFEAIRFEDGLIFEGTQLYMPDNDIQEALAASIKTDSGELVVSEFAYVVGFQAGKSPTGYTWIVDALTDTKTQDTLDSVRKLATDSKLLARFNIPALSAPATAEKAGKAK